MNFCSHCGSAVQVKIPAGDNLPRFVCESCGVIHYVNPKIVAGCIVEWQDQILLCRRAIEPRYGYWTIPAGFLENGETVAEGAARETWEEANAKVDQCELYHLYNIPHINQVYLIFRGRLPLPQFSAGSESLEVELFKEHEIPWQDLAFKVVKDSLQRYYVDKKSGTHNTYMGSIVHETIRRDAIEKDREKHEDGESSGPPL